MHRCNKVARAAIHQKDCDHMNDMSMKLNMRRFENQRGAEVKMCSLS
eukprot:UN12392